MKKTFHPIISVILILLFGCKTDSISKKNDVKAFERPKAINEVDTDIKYVIAKSGLNYRNKPKGKIIGKFKFGEQVEIKERTAIYQNIVDEGREIKGQWLGVVAKNRPDIKYVFDGFLASKKELEKIGGNFTNFIPSGYKMVYKTEGDLDGDKIDDIVLVVERKENFKGDRNVIVLLKKNKIYELDKISKTVFPPKYYSDYSNSYEKTYYLENINIANCELIIDLIGQGPLPNNTSKFKYFNEELLLISIEVYAIGAGETFESIYDVINGKIITETTNLLREDISSESTTKYVDKKKYSFENSNPRNIDF